jgi:heme-degrading monooxygenase HmoA
MVIFLNFFRVHADTDDFEKCFAHTSEFMMKKDGYRRHRLVKMIGEKNRYLNIAEWDSEDALRAAAADPQFEPHAQALRDRASSEAVMYEVIQDESA